MNEQSHLRWAQGDPTHLLDEGINYAGAWAHAQHAATSYKDSLAGAGRPDALPYLRADVNEFGVGFVDLRRLSPETAALLARALQLSAPSMSSEQDGRAA
jgi:hypothetical protein